MTEKQRQRVEMILICDFLQSNDTNGTIFIMVKK